MSLRPEGQDRRFWPEAAGVAHVSLRGRVEGATFTEGALKEIAYCLTNLYAEPGGRIERQLPKGTGFRLLTRQGDMAFGFEVESGYCGWVGIYELGRPSGPQTHWIAAAASHAYPSPEVKDTHRVCRRLSILSRVAVYEQAGGFSRLAPGANSWVPTAHLRPLGDWLPDPVAVARMFLHTPYFWGGNSADGLDCSGLIHTARRACGLDCPHDADLQMAMPGAEVPPGAEAPGDLIFWAGHVALVSAPGWILHANAFHMAVVEEPLAEAETRIAARGGGPVIRRLRPD